MTRSVEGPIHRTNYARSARARCKVAQRLERDGIKLGDRVATLAWNTWRHLEAWYGIIGHRRGLSHRQSAAVPRADRLDHQPRRRPRDDDRPDLRAAAGEARRQAADDRALRRADRRRPHAGRPRCGTPSPTRSGSARSTAISPGGRSTRTPPPACATRRARPAIPRACVYSHRSNVLHSTDRQRARRAWASQRATSSCRSCRCSTPTAGALALTAPMLGAKLVMPGAKLDGASIYELLDRLARDLHRRGADRVADAAAVSRGERREAPAPEEGGDRRLGLPARHDQDVPGRLRRRGLPCLGHDRDEPARHRSAR